MRRALQWGPRAVRNSGRIQHGGRKVGTDGGEEGISQMASRISEAQYIVNGLHDCSKPYVARLGQLATRERAREARQEEAELQHRLDLAEGEALMRELEMDEGKMSYWLHAHRRCQPPKCIGFLPPKCCCPGSARGSRG